MTFISLKIPPGIQKETPSLTSSPSWTDADKVRFKSGQPEKIGGWKATQAGVDGFLGVARSMIAWRLNNGLTVSAIGTHLKLYLYIDKYIDITPLRSSALLNDPLDTISGDATVTVNHTAHGGVTGDIVRFEDAISSTFDNAEVNIQHSITYIDVNSYSFEMATVASGSATGTGATLRIHYNHAISPTLSSPFDITNSSTTIVVNHINHDVATGDYVTFSGATHASFVDVEVNANHVMTRIDEDSYSFIVTTAATSTASGIGGSVVTEYEVPIGNEHAIGNFGFGAGSWGKQTWGTIRSVATEISELREWSLDHFGEDLICCLNGGRVYSWDATTINTDARATIVASSPSFNDLIVVTNPDRHLIAFGSAQGNRQDKMLIRWADQETTSSWVPTAENTAGDQTLSGGSKILVAARSQSSTLIWTDGGLHSMEFQGPPFTFSFQELGLNCGAISHQCVVTHNSVSYWMSDNDFFIYDGVVQTIPCTIHRHVFRDLNYNQITKVYCGLNKNFHEVIWFYPSENSIEIDRYAIYNYEEKIWYNGTFVRTVWLDSELHPYPLAADNNGVMYQHEFRDDTDDTAVDAYVESSDFDLAEGDEILFATRLVPDMTIDYGNVEYTVKYRLYPHATQFSETTQTVSATTEKLDIRMRARQVAVRVSSDESRDLWHMGVPRLDVRKDGKR
jgi:hypothetical protein